MADSKTHLIRLFLWPCSAPTTENSTHVTHHALPCMKVFFLLATNPGNESHHTTLSYSISQGVFLFNHLNLHKLKSPLEVTSRMPSTLKLTIHHLENRQARTTGSRGNMGVQAAGQAGVPQTPSGSASFTQDR